MSYVYIYILYTCIHTYIHTYILTYIHTYIHTYLHTYIHTYILTYIHTYIHTYLHTYIHTYIHTYVWNKGDFFNSSRVCPQNRLLISPFSVVLAIVAASSRLANVSHEENSLVDWVWNRQLYYFAWDYDDSQGNRFLPTSIFGKLIPLPLEHRFRINIGVKCEDITVHPRFQTPNRAQVESKYVPRNAQHGTLFPKDGGNHGLLVGGCYGVLLQES